MCPTMEYDANPIALRDAATNTGMTQLRVPKEASTSLLRQSALERDSYSATALGTVLDRATHAAIARAIGGLAPSSLAGAFAAFSWQTNAAW